MASPSRIPFLKGYEPTDDDPMNPALINPPQPDPGQIQPLDMGMGQGLPDLGQDQGRPRVVSERQADRESLIGSQQAQLADLSKPHMGQPGSSHSGFGGKLLHGLATAGNILGDIFVPNAMARIPGTQMYNDAKKQELEGSIDKENAVATKETLDQEQQQETHDKNQATNAMQQQKSLASLAQHGLKLVTDTDGQQHAVPDESSPVYQQQIQKDDTLKAQAELARANVGLRDAQTDVERAKGDPNSPAFQLAQQKLAVARQNANAAGERAAAFMGRYLQSAYNVGLDHNTLPGAPIIGDEAGNQTVVGTANAPTAIKNQGNVAQFNDVHGALDSLEQTARAVVQSGGQLNSPGIAMALSQPKGSLEQWLQGSVAKSSLTPQERAYVQSNVAAHENIQAMRKSAGGLATDSSVAKLDALVPNASTPDLNYLFGQTHQIRATADRLGKGATSSTGGLKIKPETTAPQQQGVKVQRNKVTGESRYSTDGGKTWQNGQPPQK